MFRFFSQSRLSCDFAPHPQSFVSDKAVIEDVLKAIDGNDAIELDRNPDGFVSLSRASAMVSDISGVIFDYAFVFCVLWWPWDRDR